MTGRWILLPLLFCLLLAEFTQVSATPPPLKIVTGVVSNVVTALVKWLWSLKSNNKTGSKVAVVPGRSLMKFEGGYSVETVFDGSKHGIEPYTVGVSPTGDLMVLDAQNSNLYKISSPLSGYSRPKLIAGSPEGHSGHVDGKLREARMNNPKGITVDDKGNTYIADTMNMAIRKITEGGAVTTIAGGKWARGAGHADGPSENAKFSTNFDVVYVATTCSLLVVDRGNQAIREIKLNEDDCNNHIDGNFNLGIVALVAVGFFGYMLAIFQRRVQALFSSNDDSRAYKIKAPQVPHQKPSRSVRPPLIPNEEELDQKSDHEGLISSMGRLMLNTASTALEILMGLFTGSRKKPRDYQFQQQYHHPLPPNAWPVQESFVIPDGDEPPSFESRTSTPKRGYPFMTKAMEKNPNWGYSGEWSNPYSQPQQQIHPQHLQQQQQQQQQRQQRHRNYTSNPNTYFEKSCETNEIVFGAVQEQEGRREAVVIKAYDYADPRFSHRNIRPRVNYVGYQNDY